MRIFPVFLLCGAALAQSSAPSPVIGILNYIHAVGDLDKAVAFYRDAIGFENGVPRPFPNPGVPALTNAPGVQLRLAIFKIPGAAFGWELTDFTGLDRKPAQPRPTDPGAAEIIVRVRNLDPVFAAIEKTGAPILSRSGAPVNIDTAKATLRSVLVRDPDGYLVEVIQTPPAADSPAGNILGAAMGLTVRDMDATLKFYRDLLGFQLTGKTEFTGDKAMLDIVGLPAGSQFREMMGKVPGTTADIEFREFKGMPRTSFNPRVRDPGSPALCLRVTDIEGLLNRMKAAGVKVVSAHGELVQFTPKIRNIFVEDPNGLKIELYESTP
jgi:catechol 2,3-dioxygenase-like lactoylglutathione lyase family enzyme